MKRLFLLALVLLAGCSILGSMQLAPGEGPGREETPNPVVIIFR